jgi:transcriptional regulator with XRE-family HTH domain
VEKLFSAIIEPVPRVNPLPKRDREIAARIRKFRRDSKCSRSYLADRIGVTPGVITRIELGRIPLKYDLAKDLFKELSVNPLWVATGQGEPKQRVSLPSTTALRLSGDALFSEVFFFKLLPLFQTEGPDSKSEIVLRYQRGHLNANRVKLWFTHFVPDGQVREFEEKLDSFLRTFSRDVSMEDPLRRLQRDIWYSNLVEDIKAKIAAGVLSSKSSPVAELPKTGNGENEVILDNAPLVGNTDAVKEIKSLPELIRQLKKLTNARGLKSDLARSCKVSRQAVDQWFSGSAKPSAETLFDLFEWLRKQTKTQQK